MIFYIVILPVLLLFVFAMYTWFIMIRKDLHKDAPKGSFPLPLIGNLHLLKGEPHEAIENLLSSSPNKTVRLHFGPNIYAVFSYDYDLTKEIMNSEIFNCRGTQIESTELYTPGWFGIGFASGETWRKARKFIHKSLLNPNSVKVLLPKLISATEPYLDEVEKYSKSGEAMDLLEILKIGTLSVGGILTSSVTYRFDEKGKLPIFAKRLLMLFDLLGLPTIRDVFPFLRKVFRSPWLLERERASKYVNANLNHIIDTHESTLDPDNPRDMVDEMIVDKIERNQMLGILRDLFSGSTDTSAVVLSYLFLNLINHPEAMKKVIQEIDTAFPGGNNITTENWEKCPYTQCCIDETFRMRYILRIGAPRVATQDVTIRDIYFPKDSFFFLMASCRTNDPALVKNPEEFYPERWEGVSQNERDDFNIQFGEGIRKCPGRHLARDEIRVFIIKTLSKYEFYSPNGKKIDTRAKFSFVPYPRESKVCVRKRNL